jgi:hypothetical protein
LRAAANQALRAGDAEKAKKLAQQSLEMLMKLAEAGESPYGFEGFIKGLEGIEQAADKAILASAEAARKAEIEKVRELKKEFEDLKNFKLTPSIDDEALAKETEKMKRWAAMIGESFVIRPRTSAAADSGAGEWHAPMLTPGTGAGSTAAPVSAPVKPSGIVQDASTEATLPPVSVPVKPAGIRQDGANSWTNLPAVEVDIAPKGIRQDGQNSFTNLPVDADIVVKSVAAPEGELPVVPALLRPVGPAPDVPPVPVESAIDEVSKAGVLQEFGAFIEQLRKSSVVPISLSMGPAPAAGAVPGFAGGGYTGSGGRLEPAGVVHRGEVVWSQLDVARAGGVAVVEAMRRGLRGYDMGGIVAPRALPAIPQLAPSLQEQLAGPMFPDLGRVVFEAGGREAVVYASPQETLNLRRLAMKFAGTSRP